MPANDPEMLIWIFAGSWHVVDQLKRESVCRPDGAISQWYSFTPLCGRDLAARWAESIDIRTGTATSIRTFPTSGNGRVCRECLRKAGLP